MVAGKNRISLFNWLLKKFKIHRPFKNGDMHESEKIQGAECIEHT